MKHREVSDDKLQAFLDGQLDEAEKSEIFEAIKHDEDLKREACEIRTLTELVRHAYSGAIPTEQAAAPRRRHTLELNRWGMAASVALLLGMGGVLGWVGHTPQLPERFGIKAMYWDEDRAFQNEDLNTITDRQGAKRIIVHLNTSSPGKFEKALDTAERLLETYSDVDRGTEIEVVANASAIKMLRAGYTPYAERVRELQRRYINLSFLACKDAMDHIQELEGPDSKVRLLPDVDVTPSALEHILERLSDGWVYINV